MLEYIKVSPSRLKETLAKLEEASKTAVESERAYRCVVNRLYAYDENVEQLDKTADEAVSAAREADRKFG